MNFDEASIPRDKSPGQEDCACGFCGFRWIAVVRQERQMSLHQKEIIQIVGEESSTVIEWCLLPTTQTNKNTESSTSSLSSYYF
mmetsp:Transcript_32931/g.38122  ORF Transcript_32931/g.38122 Transcript_32931/m.38122 type:complete len:84 (+) Transcript_32931:1259-1510(+)